MMVRLAEKLHPVGGKDNENLSSIDMSGVVFEENVSLESVFANNVVLTSVILPDLSR